MADAMTPPTVPPWPHGPRSAPLGLGGAFSRRPQPRGRVDGERPDGVEGGGAGAEAVAAAVAFELVAEFGEFFEVALQG
jgi:hypothetical protein